MQRAARLPRLALAHATVALAAGCAAPTPSAPVGGRLGSIDYGVQDARRLQQVQNATVIEVREVRIGQAAGFGERAVGAAAAGLACQQAFAGTSAQWTGALLCGAIGNVVVERFATSQQRAQEVVLRMDGTNQTMSLVQAVDGTDMLSPGDRVRVHSGSVQRASRAQGGAVYTPPTNTPYVGPLPMAAGGVRSPELSR